MGFFPALPHNVEIIIITIAIVYTIVSIVIQRKLSNPKRMGEIQAKIQSVQKEMNAMIKEKASQEQMMAKQKEVMPLMGESMKYSMKPMIVILPMLIITYYLIIPALPFGASNVSGIKTTFFYTVLILGLISAGFVMLYDRKKAKEEAKLLQDSDASAKGTQPNNQ